MSNSLLKIPAGVLGLGCSLLLLAALALPAARAQDSVHSNSAPDGKRQREGTTLTDQLGRFQMQGDRVVFCLENSEQTYCCLENLNLARIYKTVTETPEELQWVVSGTLTEYNNVNYLLITRAARKTQPHVPRPQALRPLPDRR